MTDDTLRAALDVGIYPAATPDGPRTPWQDGWNAGVMAVAEAVEAALATQPAGLDEEALRRAAKNVERRNARALDFWRDIDTVAAEYARLTEADRPMTDDTAEAWNPVPGLAFAPGGGIGPVPALDTPPATQPAAMTDDTLRAALYIDCECCGGSGRRLRALATQPAGPDELRAAAVAMCNLWFTENAEDGSPHLRKAMLDLREALRRAYTEDQS